MTQLSVLSWNLWWRFGPWEERLPAIVETIRRSDPDIAGLQEVWVADGTSSAEQIAEALGYHVTVRHWLELDGVGMGNAVLSRWPIAETTSVQLPGHPIRVDEERLVVCAHIDSPAGRLQAYSTHLNWRYDDSAVRQEQVRALCHFVADQRPRTYPAIVCGDFNAVPTSEEIRMMTGETAVPVDGVVFIDTWAQAGSGEGATWSNDNDFAAEEREPDRRIDYVFTGWRRPDGTGSAVASTLVGTAPIDGVWPSDHFGVQTSLRA